MLAVRFYSHPIAGYIFTVQCVHGRKYVIEI